MHIRLANRYDVKALTRLYYELNADMALLQPDKFVAAYPDSLFIDNMIADSTSDIILLEQHRILIGFALIKEMETMDHACIIPRRYAYLYDFIITAEYRNQGLGGLLLEEAKRWAKQRKLSYMELDVLAENKAAIHFYEKHGLNESVRTMQCDLE